jgi:DNA-binding NarL/FixJ family response regulator
MSQKPLLLKVDRNRRNFELLAQFLGKEGYQSVGATTDIAGFDRNIWNLCEQLRDEQIPFLVISPWQSAAIQHESLAHGARSRLLKPLVIEEVLRFIRSLLGE